MAVSEQWILLSMNNILAGGGVGSIGAALVMQEFSIQRFR